MVTDLASGIAAIGAELTSDPAAVDPPAVAVEVDGASRDLNPVVREEAYRIAGEALRNAVKHAQARRITVTIPYEARRLRVTVHDGWQGDRRGHPSPASPRGPLRVGGHAGAGGDRERTTRRPQRDQRRHGDRVGRPRRNCLQHTWPRFAVVATAALATLTPEQAAATTVRGPNASPLRIRTYQTGRICILHRGWPRAPHRRESRKTGEVPMFAATESLASDPGSLNAYFDGSQELLHAIAGVLDIRSVFHRVSEIAKGMLPHDALTMASQDEDLNIQFEATSMDAFRDVTLDPRGMPMAAELLIGDFAKETLEISGSRDVRKRIEAAGYRSLLRVATQMSEGRIGVAFWSKQAYAYDQRHLPLARRIVDHLTLGVSHERLARAVGVSDHERAGLLESAPRTIVAEAGNRRVVGESAQWREVLNQATRVAKTDTTVLVTGESGTGKEVVARFIHQASARSRGPFVALNCAALPEQLLESELFGYERGAFTSAQQAKPGQIELAANGVLFLDEVTEMSLSAQAKFLRVLQEREFQRLGGTRTIKANIRVIAATNRDLRKAVARGTFREDLFYRLQVFDIAIAPLRERADDILPLSEAILEELGRSFGRPPAGLTVMHAKRSSATTGPATSANSATRWSAPRSAATGHLST
jgi:hypothetical protein